MTPAARIRAAERAVVRAAKGARRELYKWNTKIHYKTWHMILAVEELQRVEGLRRAEAKPKKRRRG